MNTKTSAKRLTSPSHVAEMVRSQFKRFPEKAYRPIIIRDPNDNKILGFAMLNEIKLDGSVYYSMLCYGTEDQKQIQVFVDSQYHTMSINDKAYKCSDTRLQIKGSAAKVLSIFM